MSPQIKPRATKVEKVGASVVAQSRARTTPYQFRFNLLGYNRNTVNAFALPGGQIFITEALLSRLKNADELAAVLGHEVDMCSPVIRPSISPRSNSRSPW